MKIPTPDDVRENNKRQENIGRILARTRAISYLGKILFKMAVGEKEITLFLSAGHGGDYYVEIVDFLNEKLNPSGWKVDYEFIGFGHPNARVDLQIRPDS